MNQTLWVVVYESLKTKEKSSWVIPKVVAVAYESFLLKSLSDISKGVSQRWSWLELVAYEGGRKESVSCAHVVRRNYVVNTRLLKYFKTMNNFISVSVLFSNIF